MIARCPRCGCFDIHNSRPRGSMESFVRIFGIAPRRCSACGWRAIRPKWLCPPRPSKHHSSTPLPTTPSPFALSNQQPANSLPDPATQTHPVTPNQELSQHSQRHRSHRTSPRHRHSKGPRIRHKSRYGVVLAALLLGMGVGLFFYFCTAPASLLRVFSF